MVGVTFYMCSELFINEKEIYRVANTFLHHAPGTIHCSALVPFALLAYIAYFCRRLCSLFFTYTLSLRSLVK